MRANPQVVERCFELLREGRLEEADRLAGEAVEAEPDNGELWEMRGLLRQRSGDHAGACEALEMASMLVPMGHAPQCALADCYAKTGKTDLAHDMYQHLAGDPRCPTFLLPAVASGLGTLGDLTGALGVCQTWSDREPSCHEALFGTAYYMRRLGASPADVIPVMERSHELAPDRAVYRIVLASLYGRLERWDDAYDLLRDIPTGEVSCTCCIRRVMAIFWRSGDLCRYEDFRAHLDSARATNATRHAP
ncbi:hypothetical protein EP7_001453 [Isosphaeraceae bacterium EP7]